MYGRERTPRLASARGAWRTARRRSIPFIEQKSVENLVTGIDILYSPAGNLAGAGVFVDDNLKKRLENHRVPFVTVAHLFKEESGAGKTREDLEKAISEKEKAPLQSLRYRLFERVKKVYKPYNEEGATFCAPGKKKRVRKDILLERSPESLHRADILAGSQAQIGEGDLRYLYEALKAIHRGIENLAPTSSEEARSESRIPRIFLESIRLNSIYDASKSDKVRLLNAGNAAAWHATDTAILFLYAAVNMNKQRRLDGLPESTVLFDKSRQRSNQSFSYTARDKFSYRDETVLDAAMGALLHAVGLSHTTINAIASKRPTLDGGAGGKLMAKTLRQNIHVAENLLDREEVSAVAKMICRSQKEYPDGSGYARNRENAFLHEFSRLFQIIDFYDEHCNPILNPEPFGRMDVILHMLAHSGDYSYSPEKFVPGPKFDRSLLMDFLRILKPYEIFEKVHLYRKDTRRPKLYTGYVASYSRAKTYLPIVAILKDEEAERHYSPGALLFDLENGLRMNYSIQEKKVTGTEIDSALRDLEIVDLPKAPGEMKSFQDPVFGAERAE